MNTFERDFTKELEKCVTKGTADLPVVSTWNPAKPAPPEVHVARGKTAAVPLESMQYQLRRSEIFQRIGNHLGLTLSESVLEMIGKQALNDEKIQVWLFARWWFNSYCEYLLDPLTQRSAFYKERHEEFLALMRHCLEFNASRRLTFRAALSAWFPESDVLAKADQTEDSDESDDEAPPATQTAPVPAAVPVAVSPPSGAALPVSQAQQGARRLVLKGWGDSAARNKTRRNRCS
jgi:hypothetical protein